MFTSSTFTVLLVSNIYRVRSSGMLTVMRGDLLLPRTLYYILTTVSHLELMIGNTFVMCVQILIPETGAETFSLVTDSS